MTSRALDPGLARERTSLSWTRTSLAVMANGLLVMVRHEKAFPLPVAACLAGLSLVVALLALVNAALRSGVVRQPGAEVGAPTGSVVTLGVGVTVLCLATGVAIVGWS